MMNIFEEVRFSSPPPLVREAVLAYLDRRFPEVLDYMEWDSTGTHARASRLGASVTLDLSGTGPTLMTLRGSLGFLASLAVSKRQIRTHLSHAIGDLKKTTP